MAANRPAHRTNERRTAAESDAATELISRERAFGARNYDPLPVVLARGEGSHVFDVDGRRYLDLMSAYSAVSFGHAHPKIVGALIEQAQKLGVTSRAYFNNRLPPLFERLAQLTSLDRVLPANGGAEAVETAIKAARKWGYKIKGIPDGHAEIIACRNNFHGRTIVPPPGYLARCAQICREHHVLLICDEIQTGLGRIGKFLGCEHDGVMPDGVILGKALGGGLLPVSAFIATDDVMQVFHPNDHG